MPEHFTKGWRLTTAGLIVASIVAAPFDLNLAGKLWGAGTMAFLVWIVMEER